MPQLTVLIVDDSIFFRSRIRAIVESMACVEKADVAANGKIALDKLQRSAADVVILDLEMPEMDGRSLLAELRTLRIPSKVIVFSSHTRRGTEAALEALSLGAYDFVAKPGPELPAGEDPLAAIRALLEPKIAQFARPDQVPATPASTAAGIPAAPAYPVVRAWESYQPQIVLIGCSTGGPGALEQIFSQLRAPLHCPIAIVQHMPPVFTTTLAQRLSKISGLDVREAAHGEPLARDRVYLAPGDFHLRLTRDASGTRTTLDRGPQRNSVRPAVDNLFESGAELYGKDCFGVILTGMGEDGMAGAIAVKTAGGRVMIQDQASCVVFGMPGAVQRVGAYDRIGDLREIAQLINRLNGTLSVEQTA